MVVTEAHDPTRCDGVPHGESSCGAIEQMGDAEHADHIVEPDSP